MKLKVIALSILFLAFCLSANAQSGRKTVQPNEPQKQTEEKKEAETQEKDGEIKPVKLLNKPAPDVEVFAGCFRREGFTLAQTVLRVTFDASAEITKVEIAKSSGCKDFDEESIEAARRIKFEPAVKNGKPITTVRNILYRGGIGRRT